MSSGQLTEDQYECPSCFSGEHRCQDLFTLAPFGLLACCCSAPSCAQTPEDGFEARRLPGDTAPCRRCGAPIVWSVTTAKPSGPGGKAMPLDPIEHPEGNVAVQPGHAGRLLARVLAKDEHHSPPVEYLAMPHFATCGKADTS